MNKRLLSLMAAVAVFSACESIQTSTGELSRAAEGVLVATGQDTEQGLGILGATRDVLGSFSPMAPETEEAIGGSIAVKSFETQGGLHPNEELQRYVNKVGHLVARQSPRPDIPFRFAVVENETVNAWAAPGGYIFITMGALRKMENEAQLAGVLAHEVSHVTQSHMTQMLRRNQLLKGLVEGAQAATSENMSEVSQAVDAANDLLFNKGLDRDMEFESDLLGMEYAAAAGYDPQGLASFLQELSDSQAAASGGGWLQSTHPSAKNRLERLRDRSKEFEGLEGALQPERFNRIVGPAL